VHTAHFGPVVATADPLYRPDMRSRSDDAYEAVRSLRAIRAYRPEPIPPDDLEDILEAGRWTGSSKNRQGWGLVVVETPDGLEALATAGHSTGPIRDSAATIALVKTADGNDFDIGRLAQNLMLAAAARGVGSCPITLHESDRAREVLGIPDDAECHYAIALGLPDDERDAAHRADRRARGAGGRMALEDLVHRGAWGR